MLLNIVIIVSLLITTSSIANEEALQLCDQALTACEKSIETKDELIKKQEELIKTLATQRNEAFKRLSEESGSVPWYLVILVGIAGGIILNESVISK